MLLEFISNFYKYTTELFIRIDEEGEEYMVWLNGLPIMSDMD